MPQFFGFEPLFKLFEAEVPLGEREGEVLLGEGDEKSHWVNEKEKYHWVNTNFELRS